MERKEKSNEYYLVFNESGNALFRRLFKKNFSHVFVIKKHARGWIVIDPCETILNTNVVNSDFDLPKFYVKKGFAVLKIHKYWLDIPKRFLPKFMPLLTCVTLSKYALDIRSKSITPFQLYNYCVTNLRCWRI